MKTTQNTETRDQRPEDGAAAGLGAGLRDLNRMSEGELRIGERNAYLRLRGLILRELDVLAVLGLSWVPEEGRWLYLIQTPFATWPKFVVGWTDGENVAPTVVFRCGLQGAAVECFNEANFGDHQ